MPALKIIIQPLSMSPNHILHYSGGVGILVKGELLFEFDIKTIDTTYDVILSLQFRHKFTEYTFMVICCYLAPENSPWSNTTDFYSHMISQIYTYTVVTLMAYI